MTTTRQHTFYIEDEAWSEIRHYCFDHGISVSSFIASTLQAAIQPPVAKQAVQVEGKIVESHKEGDVRVVDKVQVTSAHVVDEPAFPDDLSAQPVRAVPKPSAAPKKGRRP